MDIKIGADVIGTSGKLGELERVIVDARSEKVTDLVVKHGFVFGRERVVPIAHVTGVEEGAVRLDLDEKGLEGMDGFAEAHRGADPDYAGPPGQDAQGTYRGNLPFEETVAMGSAGGYGTAEKPLGYPGGERLTPDTMQRPAITKGMDVVAADGEKVGQIGEFCFALDTGRPTRITLRRGLLFGSETELPLDWVRHLTDDGLVLGVPKSQVEALAATRQEAGDDRGTTLV